MKIKEKNIVLFLSLLALSFIFIGFDKLNWLNWLKRPVEILTNPVKQAVYNFSKQFNKKDIDSNYILQGKSDFLEMENTDLKVKIKSLEQENTAMKKLLGAPLPVSWKFIPVKVLSVSNGIMAINQGSDAGIKEGMVVIFENVLIGKIIKVNPRLSKIMLPVYKDNEIKAKVLETSNKGIVKSGAGETLILAEVLQEIKLLKDQTVITSGEEEVFPADLIIGKINNIEKDETAVYQKAILEPLVDYKSLDNVFVILTSFYNLD